MIVPMNDQIQVEIKSINETESGIILAGSGLQERAAAVVVAVSDEVTGINIGDEVLYNEKMGVTITYKDEKYYFLPKKSLFAVIRGQEVPRRVTTLDQITGGKL